MIFFVQSDFWSSPYWQTESDAYEPTVQSAQVGSKTKVRSDAWASYQNDRLDACNQDICHQMFV